MAHRLLVRALLLATLALFSAACAVESPEQNDPPSALRPVGPGAGAIGSELAVHVVLGTIVFLLVIGLLLAALWRRGRDGREIDHRDRAGIHWVLLGGVALPIVVLTGLSILSVGNLVALGEPPAAATTTVQVVGHRWWWEVRYPDEGIVTANELHVPVGEAVNVEISSADVIHSFWVPQVQRKIDALPGEVTRIWLQADTPGTFRGLCAEFCGIQHARMQLQLVAMEPDRYRDWVAANARPAAAPTDDVERQGLEVFLSTTCAYCHTIRGTPAAGQVGPDLTHIGSRLTIAGGSYRNVPGYLAGWIVDPQHLKPGALMPRTDLTGAQLQALLAYLRSLRAEG